MKKDYYEIFGIPRDVSQNEIKRAYKKLIKKWYPDLNTNNIEKVERKFKEIQEVYEVLSDSEKRGMYERFGDVGDVPPTGRGGYSYGDSIP